MFLNILILHFLGGGGLEHSGEGEDVEHDEDDEDDEDDHKEGLGSSATLNPFINIMSVNDGYEDVKDDQVTDIHLQVSVAKREQGIKLKEMDYDEKKKINKRKKLIAKGLDPDEVEREKKKAWKRKKRMESRARQQQKN